MLPFGISLSYFLLYSSYPPGIVAWHGIQCIKEIAATSVTIATIAADIPEVSLFPTQREINVILVGD